MTSLFPVDLPGDWTESRFREAGGEWKDAEKAAGTPAEPPPTPATVVDPLRCIFKSLEMRIWPLGHFSTLLLGKHTAAFFNITRTIV